MTVRIFLWKRSDERITCFKLYNYRIFCEIEKEKLKNIVAQLLKKRYDGTIVESCGMHF